MDLEVAMDMSQDQLMHIISQLDSALTSSPSPSASPYASPPHQSAPPASRPVPPGLFCGIVGSSRAQVAPVLHHRAAAAAVQVPQDVLCYCSAAATVRHQLVGIDDDAEAPRPQRRNARVSSEPQSVAARLRRERVSQRMRALQRLVPGGARLDTASMLEEAIRYVKFLKAHVQSLERAAAALHGRRVGRAEGDVVAVAGGGDIYCPSYYA